MTRLPLLRLALAAAIGATAGCAGGAMPGGAMPGGAMPAGPRPPEAAGPGGLPLPFGVPALRGRAGPSDQRPPWLPALPETIERFPAPQDLRRDSFAAL
jgi:hypothetical protein